MVIIAIVGMAGSGKSEVTDHLINLGFSKLRFGQVTIDILKKNNLKVNEKNEREVREKLRKDHGMEAYAKLNLPKIKQKLSETPNIVLDGLYSWEEYLFLKNKFPDIKVIAVYCSPKTRYKRLKNRKIRPLKEQEAFSRDKSEIENLHKAGPIAMADYTIINESNLKELKLKINKLIQELK